MSRHFAYSLVSVSALAASGVYVQFNEDSARVQKNNKTLASETRVGGLYSLDISTQPNSRETALVANLNLWHERMGHVHKEGIVQMARNNVVEGLRIAHGNEPVHVCEGCVMGKMHRTPILEHPLLARLAFWI